MARLAEGTRLAVGSHEVTVVRFLLEGGFSQIYEVVMEPHEGDSEIGCLKQVIVPDKAGLNTLRKEVEVMKTLRKAQSIVRYYDSNAERLENGTYQVLVLMELCPNKSLLDYMNAHIREKLSEKDILKIMRDITVGIYEMHKLKLVHRDIKIENVLIDAHHHFKLCDFGSVSSPIRPPKDQNEFRALSNDIMYQTTPQYRSPEMIDLYRGFPIDEKADIWALGCFLYKLCYYTTPFEANGDIAILHASFQFPPAPVYSGDLKNLIIIMLQESPLYRPNIVQILMLLCRMMSIEFSELGVDDFYHAGEYNFQALHEMQRQKQNELLKQQQYYYEQQKQQQEIESRRQELRAKQSLLPESGTERPSAHASVVDLAHKSSSKSPHPRPVLRNSSPPTLQIDTQAQQYAQPIQQELKSLATPSLTAAQHNLRLASSNSHLQAVQQQVSANQSGPERAKYNLRPKEHETTDIVRSVSQLRIPATSPELTSTKSIISVNSIVSDSDEFEDDLDHLTNLEEAENKYPSLDALDGAKSSDGNTAVTNDKVPGINNETPNTPQLKILRAASIERKLDEQPPSQLYGLSAETPGHNRHSEFETIEAWKKLSTSINKDAERLVEEIFLSRTTTNEPTSKVQSEPMKSAGTSLDSVERARNFEKAENGSAREPEKPPVRPKHGEFPSFTDRSSTPQQLQLLSSNAASSQPATSKPVQPVNSQSVTSQLVASQPMHPQLLNSLHMGGGGAAEAASSFPFPQQQFPDQQQFTENKNSNPWGDVIRRKEPQRFDSSMTHSSSFYGNSSAFDLNQQVLKLNIDEAPAPTHKPSENLIELESGLSSLHPGNAPPLPLRPPSRYQDISLLDLEVDEELGRRKDGKPLFKKKISDIQNQPMAFQEEVIDFASDDENNKSEMSRMAIRNSLRKPKSRKLSDHHPSHKRSESSNAEHRKRLSFFGGSQD